MSQFAYVIVLWFVTINLNLNNAWLFIPIKRNFLTFRMGIQLIFLDQLFSGDSLGLS